ncbi:MAG: histone H1/H5 family protein [Aestuariibacter sp.]|nr:histone H1/H5 family protein [Aestuariibacter sp.]
MTDAAKKSKAAAPAHPTYASMVAAAVGALKERTGSSRHAIKKYVKGNYDVKDNADLHINRALKNMLAKDVLVQAKGCYKLAKKPKEAAKKPAAKKPKAAAAKKTAAKKPAAKKPAAKKAKSPKKAAKKPAAKKAASKKVKKSPKKAATKAKKPVAKKSAKKPAKKSAKAKK